MGSAVVSLVALTGELGKPIVIACMRSGGGSIDACREKARPQVVACVVAALNAANRRDNVAIAIPTEAAPKLVPPWSVPLLAPMISWAVPSPGHQATKLVGSGAQGVPVGSVLVPFTCRITPVSV